MNKAGAVFCVVLLFGFYHSRGQSLDKAMAGVSSVPRTEMGSLSVLDEGNAEEAKAYLNDQLIGTVPFVRMPMAPGDYVLSVRKERYISSEKEYEITIRTGEDYQLRVSMELFRNIWFLTDPPNAEIWLDGQLAGLSNDTLQVPILFHSLLVSKPGYATEKFNIFIDEGSPETDVIQRVLRKKYPLTIRNEGQENYNLTVEGLDSLSNVVIDNKTRISGQENQLPYGRYRLTLKDGRTVVYKGRHLHSSDHKPFITVPAYSRNSFRALSVDYVSPDNIEFSLGESQLFAGSGLTTSIINMHYLFTEINRSPEGLPQFVDTMAILLPSVFGLNWDFRIGGSVFRFLDISALGRYKYSPGLTQLGVNVKGLNDATAHTLYYGVELSTRLPYFNINLKAGNQIIRGRTFIFDSSTGDYTYEYIRLDKNWPVVSVGIVIQGPIERTNNMLRLWRRPLLDDRLRRVFRKY